MLLEATVTRSEGIACKFFALTWTGIHVVGPSRTDVTKCIFSSKPHTTTFARQTSSGSLRDSPKRLNVAASKMSGCMGKIFDLTTLFDARTSSRSEAEVQQSLVAHKHTCRAVLYDGAG